MLASPLQRMRTQTVYSTPLVRLGRFQARPSEPLFSAITPPGHYLVAFPETALAIAFDRGGEHVVDPNWATFYHPDEIYRRRALSAIGDHCNWISVGPELLTELQHRAGPPPRGAEPQFSAPVARVSGAQFLGHRRLFSRAASTARRVDALEVEERAMRLLRGLFQAQCGERDDRVRLSDASRRAVQRAQELITARLDQPHTVESVARQVGLSPFHLCRCFRAATGSSLHAYRTTLRLHHAMQTLPNANDLTGLALDLGFASHSHFSERFKAHFGCTPRSVSQRLAA